MSHAPSSVLERGPTLTPEIPLWELGRRLLMTVYGADGCVSAARMHFIRAQAISCTRLA